VDVERLRGSEPVDVPDLVDEALARDDAARVVHEQGEQVELLAREVERLAVDRRGARRRVERDDADGQHAGAGRRGDGARAPQHGADARHQLAGAERLDDVVVGAELEAGHAVDLVATGGQHDHGGVAGGAQLAQGVEARAVRQHDVQQHEVGTLVGGDPQPVGDRAGDHGAKALVSQRLGQRGGDGLLVLDHEDDALLDVHALIVGRA
jgi:hypothetical protein